MKLTSWGNFPIIDAHISVPEKNQIFESNFKGISRGLGRSYGDSALNKNKLPENDDLVEGNERELLFDILEDNSSDMNLVRYSVSEINSLFVQVNYNLKDVRDSKLVKPVNIGLLPNEIKNIGNTKKRKDIFIKIVLPLIVIENNKIIKIFDKVKTAGHYEQIMEALN